LTDTNQNYSHQTSSNLFLQVPNFVEILVVSGIWYVGRQTNKQTLSDHYAFISYTLRKERLQINKPYIKWKAFELTKRDDCARRFTYSLSICCSAALPVTFLFRYTV